MSEHREQMDYEALNADTAMRLNKAQQRIRDLEAEIEEMETDLEAVSKKYVSNAEKLYSIRCIMNEDKS